jgi:two-component system response regulator HydG
MRKGRFEHAHGGTLFLDEVGDMPWPLQAKLLRVLEDGQVIRIGANEPIKVDVRLISATHRDLEVMISEGKFRQDLYHRLKVGTIRLPPLRERGALDIALLAEHFLKEFNKEYRKQCALSPELLQAFKEYAWPGNVRELRNVLESLVVQDHDGVLSFDDLDEGEPLRRALGGAAAHSGADALVGRPLEEVERYYMNKALEMTGGNREEAAKILGIGERTLYRRIKEANKEE